MSGLDEIIQEQLNHMAHQTMKATGVEIAIICTIKGQALQTAVASVSPPGGDTKKSQIKVTSEVIRALTQTADALLQNKTSGKFCLMVKTPSGLHTVGEGVHDPSVEYREIRG